MYPIVAKHTVSFLLARIAYQRFYQAVFRSSKAQENSWYLLSSVYILANFLKLSGYLEATPIHQCRGDTNEQPRIHLLDTFFALDLSKHLSNFVWETATSALDREILLHHLLTLLLTGLCLSSNNTCLGIHIMPYMLWTNPLQHTTRTLHVLYPKATVTKIGFVLFMAQFFSLRVVAYPIFFIYPLLIDMRGALTAPVYAGAATLVLGIYGLQMFWFGKMVGILKRSISRKN